MGYPTENALKSWHREYERCLDLPRGYVRAKPKYSQDQKEQAVEHYVAHGRCIALTIKALGYPGRDSLRAWIREFHPELHTRVVSRSTGSARPPAMKKAAVIALCMRQDSAQAVAQELGVCRPTLYNWKNQLLGPEKPATMKRRHETPSEQRPVRVLDVFEQLQGRLAGRNEEVHKLHGYRFF